MLETSLAKALDLARPAVDGRPARAPQIREALAQLETELARLVAGIATGGPLASLLTAVQDGERRRAQLRVELATLEPDHGARP